MRLRPSNGGDMFYYNTRCSTRKHICKTSRRSRVFPRYLYYTCKLCNSPGSAGCLCSLFSCYQSPFRYSSLCCAARQALEHSPTRLKPRFVVIFNDSSGAYLFNLHCFDAVVTAISTEVSKAANPYTIEKL